MISLVPSYISSAAFASLCQRDRMISSSRSMLYRFLILYGLLYAGFGVQSPYLPILLDNRHLRPETIALALAAGTAMRLMAAQAVARLADRWDAPKVFLALCTTAAALIGLGYLPAQGAWLLIAVGVLHSAALAPLPPLTDTLALGAAAPAAPPPATHRHARPRCRGSRRVRRRGHPLRLAARGRRSPLCAGLGAVPPGLRTFRDRRNRLAKHGAACCRGTHGTWCSTTIGDRWPPPGHAEPGSRGRSVVATAALSQDGFARNVDSWESCDARLLCDDPLEQSRNQPRHVWHLVVAFGRRRGRRLPLRPFLARPHRPGRRRDALRRRRCRAMGSDGRDRVASGGGGDRALARPNVRALASDVHATFGAMRSKAPRGDGTDHLRYRRHRYCNRSSYACVRPNFRALRGARVLGNGGPLCGGVAARPNPARTDGRFQVIFFARPII